MSNPVLTIATLPRLTAQQLSNFLLSSPSNSQPISSIAIIDVRDSDHIGGHIRHSQHIPSSTLDYQIPDLVRTLKDKKVVVFHCMLSQQRGPSAALRYARERERLLAGGGHVAVEEGAEGQRVCVLEGGFDKWRQQWVTRTLLKWREVCELIGHWGRFGEDERLTEGYDKKLWDEGGE